MFKCFVLFKKSYEQVLWLLCFGLKKICNVLLLDIFFDLSFASTFFSALTVAAFLQKLFFALCAVEYKRCVDTFCFAAINYYLLHVIA